MGQATAVVAIDAVPVLQLDVRAAGVVRFEDLPNHDEEIQEPPLLQRPLDRRPPIALAKLTVLDVRVGGVGMGGGRIGINRNHGVRLLLAQFVPAKLDSETPQVGSFEDDGAGDCRDVGRFEANVHVVELVAQRDKIAKDVVPSRPGFSRVACIDPVQGLVDLAAKVVQRTPEVLAQTICRPMPLAARGFLHLTDQVPTAVPGGVGQPNDRPGMLHVGQRFVNGAAGSQRLLLNLTHEFTFPLGHGNGRMESTVPATVFRMARLHETDRALDLRRREADSVSLAENLIRRNGLAVDPDQVVVRAGRFDLLLE